MEPAWSIKYLSYGKRTNWVIPSGQDSVAKYCVGFALSCLLISGASHIKMELLKPIAAVIPPFKIKLITNVRYCISMVPHLIATVFSFLICNLTIPSQMLEEYIHVMKLFFLLSHELSGNTKHSSQNVNC